MTSNRLKADAREYMSNHPGVSYQEALRAIAGTSITPNRPTAKPHRDRPTADNIPEPIGASELPSALDDLIGLDNFKKLVCDALQMTQLQAELARRDGRKVDGTTMHFAFTGPAGTGKTTAAYALARELHAHGVIERDQVTHLDRHSLVAGFVGATAEKTTAALHEARGGVVVIDAAHDLVLDSRERDPFGQEALATIAQFMTDHDPQDLIVIFTGNEIPLSRMLDANPRLHSAIRYHARFPSFSPEQLWQILLGHVQHRGLRLDPEAHDTFGALATALCEKTNAHGHKLIDVLANGRFPRSTVDRAEVLSAQRLMSDGIDLAALSDAQFLELTRDDLMTAAEDIAAVALK